MTERLGISAINARFKTPRQVANDFVIPPFFDQIVSPNHTLIYGPRGSGKTTLLTMLRQEALREWHGTEADNFSGSIEYHSVFIRTESTWGAQIVKLVSLIPADVADAVSKAMYVTHALRCFNREILDRLRFGLVSGAPPTSDDVARTSEAQFADYCADALSLELGVPSLAGLNAALSRRQLRTMAAAVEFSRGDLKRKDLSSELPFLDGDLFLSLGIMADAAELIGFGDVNYALLLDELEILPSHLRDYVFSNLRSADGRFLIKMSVSPVEESFAELQRSASATDGDDFLSVDLTHPHKTTSDTFTRDLLLTSARRAGYEVGSVDELLGSGRFDPAEPKGGGAYAPGSRVLNAFERLRDADHTFANWLNSEKINLARVPEMSEKRKARTVRKVRDIVAIRDLYRVADEDYAKMTGKKRRYNPSSSLRHYSGTASVAALLEGNPRWIVNFVNALASRTPAAVPISPGRQGQALTTVLHRVRSRIRFVPPDYLDQDDVTGFDDLGRATLNLVDQIGEALREGVLVNEFDPDPALSVIVDSDSDRLTEKLVEIAVKQGALVPLSGSSSLGPMSTVRGGRFRLAYIFAADHRLPLHFARAVSLSSLRIRLSGSSRPPDSPALFG